jgi:hypothetical protein
MLVKCERDGTKFEATVQPYPSKGSQSEYYDKDGDKRIVCPTCGRAYFHYNSGEEAGGKTGWHSDRQLTILEG